MVPICMANFLMMCILHQNLPFYVFFPFICFERCFMKVFYDFFLIWIWYFFALNTGKAKVLGFSCIQLRSPILLNEILFWQKTWYDTRYNIQKYCKMPAILDTLFLNIHKINHKLGCHCLIAFKWLIICK